MQILSNVIVSFFSQTNMFLSLSHVWCASSTLCMDATVFLPIFFLQLQRYKTVMLEQLSSYIFALRFTFLRVCTLYNVEYLFQKGQTTISSSLFQVMRRSEKIDFSFCSSKTEILYVE